MLSHILYNNQAPDDRRFWRFTNQQQPAATGHSLAKASTLLRSPAVLTDYTIYY
jgi:hypothetical protein